MGDQGFRLDIQGLRGVAVLLVVLFHAGLGVPGGFVGVDVFFVISGFVIGRGLVDEASRTGSVHLRRFYSRRIRRLLPALAVMLTIVGLGSVLLLSPAFPQQQALQTARAATLSVSNLFLWREGGGYFSPLDEQNPFVHTWSLGVEEQFYMLFPLIVYLSWRLARRWAVDGRRACAAVVSLAASASFVASVVLTFGVVLGDTIPKVERFAFYGPVTRVWEFAAGVLIALANPAMRRFRTAALGGLVGIGMIGVASWLFTASTQIPGVAAVVPVAGAALVIVSNGGPISSALKHPSLVWLGDRSYSWYLWHWPFIVLAPIAFPSFDGIVPIAAVVSILPSIASYRYVEQRFRLRPGVPVGLTAPRLAVLSFAVPLIVVGGALQGAQRGWGLDRHPELTEPTTSQSHRCFEASTEVERCTFGDVDAPKGTILLVGDSHADSISDAVIAAGAAEGYEVVVQTYLSCPFITEPMEFEPDCIARQAHDRELIATIRPEVLVIANRSTTAIAAIDEAGEGADAHDAASSQALRDWQGALEHTFRDVEPDVGRVVLFSVVPYFQVDDFDRALPSLVRPSGTWPTEHIDTIQRSRGPILDAEGAASVAVPGLVTILDPMPQLCDDDMCTIRTADGSFLYRDNNHLTAGTARELTDWFREAFRDDRFG